MAALIIKEMFSFNDEQLLLEIMTNITVQVVLGPTSQENIELSDRSFGRFRQRLNAYKEETGIDLIAEEEKALASEFCKGLKIDGRKKRLDSLMINSRGKYITRLELIHVTNANCLKEIKNTGREQMILDSLKHYLNSDDTNRIVYHQGDEELEPRLYQAINNSFLIKEIMEREEALKLTVASQNIDKNVQVQCVLMLVELSKYKKTMNATIRRLSKFMSRGNASMRMLTIARVKDIEENNEYVKAIKQKALNDHNYMVRKIALKAVA